MGRLQHAAALLAFTRLAQARHRRAPLQAAALPAGVRVSVVIPARDEERRLGPLLDALEDAHEVLVVDDCSRDGTAALARSRGATVIAGSEPPSGWIGKPWALEQGLRAARGDVVVCLDADTLPAPGLLGALARDLERFDWVTLGPRFDSRGAGRWLHAALLSTLIFRLGVGDTETPGRRVPANGQCQAFRRAWLTARGGFAPCAPNMTDDVAIASALAARGARVAFREGHRLLLVRTFDGFAHTWHGWGRSIAMADVSTRGELASDLALVWLVQSLPMLRVLWGRPRRLDVVLTLVRFTLLGFLRRHYSAGGPAFWLSPLADPLAALRLTLSALRPPRSWRGRRYGTMRP